MFNILGDTIIIPSQGHSRTTPSSPQRNVLTTMTQMAAASSKRFGKIAKVKVFNPVTEIVQSLRKRIDPAFRPAWDRVPVSNCIESCCFSAEAMKDYIAEYHTFLANPKWNWKLALSTRLDMNKAWVQLTPFEFWAVEESGNIGRTYILRFDDCTIGQQQKIHIGNAAEILQEGKAFRDGDLCYCFREDPDGLSITELFYLETINGKKGFVVFGTHKWVPQFLDDWKLTISNLLAMHYFDEQPGSFKVYGN